MSELPAVEGKPPRIITVYVPAAFALLAGVFLRSDCSCGWPVRSGEAVLIVLLSFLFLWPVVLALHHGFRFVRSLFQRHPPAPPGA